MTLLIFFVLVALVFSFLCSIAEAVLLSVSQAHLALMKRANDPAGEILAQLKRDVSTPLAAILTLNTIAHTVGAAGAGAQAAVVFGDNSLGVASAILTLLILVFSEIIPKTLGARYWRSLARPTAYGLRILIWLLYPFVKMSALITRRMEGSEHHQSGLSREEFAAMTDLSAEHGRLGLDESTMLKNILFLKDIPVRSIMTPRPVVFSLSDDISVQQYFYQHDDIRFSRIPVWSGDKDNVVGFVLRSDLLLAQARGNVDSPLSRYVRELPAVLETTRLDALFQQMIKQNVHLMLVVDEYGSPEGIVAQEDVMETILGLEIVDENDTAVDLQKKARSMWQKRAREIGLDIGEDDEKHGP